VDDKWETWEKFLYQSGTDWELTEVLVPGGVSRGEMD